MSENETEKLAADMGELDTTEPSKPTKEKKVSSAKKKSSSAKKVVAPKKVASKSEKPAKKEVNENLVSLKTLCKELKMDSRIARRKLRDADMKAEGRWAWEKDSAALKKVEKILTKEDEKESKKAA